ncbi:hypothetical protein Bca52824_097131, partial [Brassica carinata]
VVVVVGGGNIYRGSTAVALTVPPLIILGTRSILDFLMLGECVFFRRVSSVVIIVNFGFIS